MDGIFECVKIRRAPNPCSSTRSKACRGAPSCDLGSRLARSLLVACHLAICSPQAPRAPRRRGTFVATAISGHLKFARLQLDSHESRRGKIAARRYTTQVFSPSRSRDQCWPSGDTVRPASPVRRPGLRSGPGQVDLAPPWAGAPDERRRRAAQLFKAARGLKTGSRARPTWHRPATLQRCAIACGSSRSEGQIAAQERGATASARMRRVFAIGGVVTSAPSRRPECR